MLDRMFVYEPLAPFLAQVDLIQLSRVCRTLNTALANANAHEMFYPFTSGHVVAYWKFQREDAPSDSVCVDSSGRNHHGVLAEGAEYYMSGRGVYLSEGRYIEVEGSEELYMSVAERGCSVEAWVHVHVLRASLDPILSQGDDDGGWELGLMGNQAMFQIHYRSAENAPRTARCIGTFVYKQYWMHLAGTFDGEVLRLYVDRKLVDAQRVDFRPADLPPEHAPAPLCMARSASRARSCHCDLSSVRITRACLDPHAFLRPPRTAPLLAASPSPTTIRRGKDAPVTV